MGRNLLIHFQRNSVVSTLSSSTAKEVESSTACRCFYVCGLSAAPRLMEPVSQCEFKIPVGEVLLQMMVIHLTLPAAAKRCHMELLYEDALKDDAVLGFSVQLCIGIEARGIATN